MMNVIILILSVAVVLLAVGWWGENLGFMWGNPFVFLFLGAAAICLDVLVLLGWAIWSYLT